MAQMVEARIVFQVHLWVGAAAAAYLLLMSVSGSAIVFRNEFNGNSVIEWLVRLHTNLLTGMTGRFVNGIGGASLTVLCLSGAVIWWPGTKHWRRSLSVDWSGHFARMNWDLHSALGFWLFPFVLLWGVSGFYFAFPGPFNILYDVDPGGGFANFALDWLPDLHFGRFGWFTQTLWVLFGICSRHPCIYGYLHLLPTGYLQKAVEPQKPMNVACHQQDQGLFKIVRAVHVSNPIAGNTEKRKSSCLRDAAGANFKKTISFVEEFSITRRAVRNFFKLQE